MPTFWKLPFVFHGFYEGFQVFKGFHGLFFKKGRGYPEAKVPEDLWGCNRENIFTGKPWDGVGAKGREPVFRVKIIIEKALLCGKKNRAFLIKFTSFVGEVLGDRETFIFSGKREGGGTAWRLGRPTYKVGREGVVLRLDHQGLFGVYVPLTHRGRRKVVAARGSKQCPPRGIRRVHSGSGVGRWVGEVDNVHMRSMKREGVKGKAENNTRCMSKPKQTSKQFMKLLKQNKTCLSSYSWITMTSLGGADRAIIRMKASRAVCSRRIGVSAGGGGRTVVGGSSGGREPLWRYSAAIFW